MFQFVPMASRPTTGRLWKEPGALLFAASFQAVTDISKIPCQSRDTSMTSVLYPFLLALHCYNPSLRGGGKKSDMFMRTLLKNCLSLGTCRGSGGGRGNSKYFAIILDTDLYRVLQGKGTNSYKVTLL